MQLEVLGYHLAAICSPIGLEELCMAKKGRKQQKNSRNAMKKPHNDE
jgi:hypothetical protein